MDGEIGHQPKQERLRTKWTASLDKIFANLVVEQIQLGNRPNSVFDKKAWSHIRESFNKQTDLNFNNNQLRKHLDVLRTRYHNLKSAFDQNDFALEDSCCIGFELWEDIEAQPRTETIKVKDCPIYEQLCTIFTESGGDGKYAQSSHYEELISKSSGTDTAGLASCLENGTSRPETPSSRSLQGKAMSITTEKQSKDGAARGKKRPPEAHSSLDRSSRRRRGIGNAIAEAMLEMIAASNLTTETATKGDDLYSISNCIRALDEMEAVDQRVYFSALDLFDQPSLRETFISLKSNEKRLAWLKEQWVQSIPMMACKGSGSGSQE